MGEPRHGARLAEIRLLVWRRDQFDPVGERSTADHIDHGQGVGEVAERGTGVVLEQVDLKGFGRDSFQA